jgi:hypothetical protein
MRIMRARSVLYASLFTFIVLLSLSPASASSANLSRSYASDTKIKDGSLVTLDNKQTDFVAPADTTNGERLVGVAVSQKDSLLAVDPTDGAIQVATSGNANALVSTLNGDVKIGDQVGVSPFSGVGMKAEAGTRVIGVAQTPFNKNTQGATAKQVTGKDGKTTTIYVGYVRVSIAIGSSDAADDSAHLTKLQRLVKSVTGREISSARIIVALVIATIAILSLIVLVYSAIYGSIISIGRNPLAKFAVFRTLGSVMAMVMLIAVLATLTIFFLLR